MDAPRLMPIHHSLIRPHLLLGAERHLVLFCGLLSALVMFSGTLSLFSVGFGVVFWVASLWALVRMGRADAQMSRVYQRHVAYRRYYMARGCLRVASPPLRHWG